MDTGNRVYSTPSRIPLKLYRCLGHGLKMCILFGYNPQISLSLFFQVEHSHFSYIIPFKVNR